MCTHCDRLMVDGAALHKVMMKHNATSMYKYSSAPHYVQLLMILLHIIDDDGACDPTALRSEV